MEWSKAEERARRSALRAIHGAATLLCSIGAPIGPVDHMLSMSQATAESPVAFEEAIPEKISLTATRQATTKRRVNENRPPTTRRRRFGKERRGEDSDMDAS